MSIKIVILTLAEFNFRLHNLQPLIESFKSVGFCCDIFFGICGTNLEICDTSSSNIKIVKNSDSTIKYLHDTTKRPFNITTTIGEFGCAISHRLIYENLLKDDKYDNYLILEDDCVLLTEIDDLVNHIKNIPTDYDLCHIAKSDFYPFIRTHKVNDYFATIGQQHFNRATAYLVSKKGVKKMVDFMGEYINYPGDDLFGHVLSNVKDFKFYVPLKHLFREVEGPERFSLIGFVDKKK